MPKIRTWQTKTGSSTRSAQFAPVQTRVTGQKQAFLERYQPQTTAAEAANEVSRVRGFKDRQASILVGAAVQMGTEYIGYKHKQKEQAAAEAYKAESDSLAEGSKSAYLDKMSKVSAEQKYAPMEGVDKNGNLAFATDTIKENYNKASNDLAAEISQSFAGRADAQRIQSEFDAWRTNVDAGHKNKLFQESAAMSFKNAQARFEMEAMKATSEPELERILTKANDNGIYSAAALYELKMKATERIHTNNFSANIDALGGMMDKMSEEQYGTVRDGLVAQLWDDNDDLIITKDNRTLMVKKIQALDNMRDGVLSHYQESQFINTMQEFSEADGDLSVIRSAALSPNASEELGQKNHLTLLKMLNDPKADNIAKLEYQNDMYEQIWKYKTGQITDEALKTWAIENQANVGNISPAFTALTGEHTSQEQANIKAVRDQMSYHYTGMRVDEQDLSGSVGREAKADWAKAQADLTAWVAENPSGVDAEGNTVREWSMSRILEEPLDPEVRAITDVGENLLDTDWDSLVEGHRDEITTLKRQYDGLQTAEKGGEIGRDISARLRTLRENFTTLIRYQRTYNEINKPQNASVIKNLKAKLENPDNE